MRIIVIHHFYLCSDESFSLDIYKGFLSYLILSYHSHKPKPSVSSLLSPSQLSNSWLTDIGVVSFSDLNFWQSKTKQISKFFKVPTSSLNQPPTSDKDPVDRLKGVPACFNRKRVHSRCH